MSEDIQFKKVDFQSKWFFEVRERENEIERECYLCKVIFFFFQSQNICAVKKD